MTVSCDLILKMSKESSLLLGLDSSVIDYPLLIFEELAILNKSLVDIGSTLSTYSSMNSSVYMSSSVCMSSSVSVSSSVCMSISVCVYSSSAVNVACFVKMS